MRVNKLSSHLSLFTIWEVLTPLRIFSLYTHFFGDVCSMNSFSCLVNETSELVDSFIFTLL